jgi:hypothetical protein
MVVRDFDVVSIRLYPDEADPVLPVGADAVLPGALFG